MAQTTPDVLRAEVKAKSENNLYIKPTVSLLMRNKNEISFILKYSNGSLICKTFEKTCVVLENQTQEFPKTGHKILPDAALSLR